MGTTKNRQEADELGMLIGRSRRLVFACAARALEARQESMLTWQVLNRLRWAGSLTQCELAFQTAQHPAGISRLLQALEREGQVRRARDASDRRKVVVELTEKGQTRLRATDPHVAAAAEQAFAPLSAPERRALRGLLRKLLGLDGTP